MKKGIVVVVVVWVLMILGLFLILSFNSKTTESKSYRVTVNRLHYELSNMLKEDGYQTAQSHILSATKAHPEINSITIIESNTDKTAALIAKDLESNRLIFSKVEATNYLIRYEISEILGVNDQIILYSTASLTVLSAFLIIILIYVHRRLIRPLKELSVLPKKLAKGHFNYKVQQHKYRYYREFLWSLDMLREVLENEKKKNLELEKNRKTLVASLSHDINTPLSSIQNYCNSLIDNIYEDECSKTRALNIIKEKALVIEKLTKDLLKSSKNMMDSLEIMPKEIYTYDLLAVLDKLISQNVVLHSIDYQCNMPENNWLLYIDVDRVIEVVDNIIENAIKYGDGKHITMTGYYEDNCLLLKIDNTGQHIPEQELKYVFSSFYRGSNIGNKPGHGLGLYITKKVMRAMDGDAYIQNTAQGVCTVIIIKIIL